MRPWEISYMLIDFLSASLVWLLFFIYRKINEIPEAYFEWRDVWNDQMLYWGMLLIPLGWIILYFGTEQYQKIARQSRIIIAIRTFFQSILGGFVLLLTVLVDDDLLKYKSYITPFFILISIHFLITILSRTGFLTILKGQIKAGRIGFNTLIVGSGPIAQNVYTDLKKIPSWGYNVLGFVGAKGSKFNNLPILGDFPSVSSIVNDHSISEVVFVKERDNSQSVQSFLNTQYPFHKGIQINVSAHEPYNLSKVKIRPIPNTEVLAIDLHDMSNWEKIVKRLFDILVSLLLLLLLLPLFFWITIKVKLSSSGPVFFTQDRLGFRGQKFRILKFRSMFEDSEKSGPALSFDGDERCTKFGAFMRKWRLDEMPQFINVIKGDMSLIGPRPERQYYIDQLIKEEPRYNYLLSVRPGITSLGQVKYGYASNLQQMQKRLKFDLLYLENRSLRLDIKILFYTFLVLLQGQGK